MTQNRLETDNGSKISKISKILKRLKISKIFNVNTISLFVSLASAVFSSCQYYNTLALEKNQRVEENILKIREQYNENISSLERIRSDSVSFSLAFYKEEKFDEKLYENLTNYHLNFDKFNDLIDSIVNDDAAKNDETLKNLGKTIRDQTKKLKFLNSGSIIESFKTFDVLNKASSSLSDSINRFDNEIESFSKNFDSFISEYRKLKSTP